MSDEQTTLSWMPMTFSEFQFYLAMFGLRPIHITWIRPRHEMRVSDAEGRAELRPKAGVN